MIKRYTSKHLTLRIVNRISRLDDLKKYSRLIDDFNTDFVARFNSLFDRPGSLQPQTDLQIRSHLVITQLNMRPPAATG